MLPPIQVTKSGIFVRESVYESFAKLITNLIATAKRNTTWNTKITRNRVKPLNSGVFRGGYRVQGIQNNPQHTRFGNEFCKRLGSAKWLNRK
jgi:hypothetical protein